MDRAIAALSDPARFRDAESRVAEVAPQLQVILAEALHQGGWFSEANDTEVRKAVSAEYPEERIDRVRTLLAEETRMGMLVGVAVGWELARELDPAPPASGPSPHEGG